MPVEGAEEVIERLASFSKKVQREIVGNGVKAGAQVIQQSLKNASRGKTGELSAKVRIRKGKARKGASRLLVGWSQADDVTSFASFVDWGHRIGLRPLKSFLGNLARSLKRTIARSTRGQVQGTEFLEKVDAGTSARAESVAKQVIEDGIEAESWGK